MKNKCVQSILWVTGVLLFWIIYIYLFWNGEKLIKEANEVFSEVVVLDKAQRGDGYLNNFSSQGGTESANDSIQVISEFGETTLNIESKNELSYDEKKYVCDQLYLLYKNPIRADHLDSLFNEKLQAEGIEAETAIVYKVQMSDSSEMMECSRTDSSFYKKATALPLMKIGNTIELEGYVSLSEWTIWNRIPYIWMVTVLLSCLGIGGFVFIGYKKEKKVEVENENKVNKDLIGYIQIREDLYFKETEGFLLYKDQKIYLRKRHTELLAFLLRGDSYFRSYEELQNKVWKVENLTRDAMRVAVKRLNDNLEEIPGFSVETVSGKGFRIDVCS